MFGARAASPPRLEGVDPWLGEGAPRALLERDPERPLPEERVGDGTELSGPLVVEPALEELARLLAACSARTLSICIEAVMKSCQISAGNVPPSTGPPLKALVIGTRLLG